jgi:GntR family transcriptional repressor for pyruvate dehydrogenase complex
MGKPLIEDPSDTLGESDEPVASAVSLSRRLFLPARRVRSFEDVVEQIRDAIFSGKLEPGDRLSSERELCSIFGVSRATVREAVRTLEAFGLVEIRLGAAGGIFAAMPDQEQTMPALEVLFRVTGSTIRDLAEFRLDFESQTAYFAALRADDEDIKTLEKIADEFITFSSGGSSPWHHVIALDQQFHVELARIARSQIRLAITLAIHRSMHRAFSALAPVAAAQSFRDPIEKQVRAIAAAIADHQPDQARELMRQHVEGFLEEVGATLNLSAAFA